MLIYSHQEVVVINNNTLNSKNQPVKTDNSSPEKTDLIQVWEFFQEPENQDGFNASGLIEPAVFYDENLRIIPYDTVKLPDESALQEPVPSVSAEPMAVSNHTPQGVSGQNLQNITCPVTPVTKAKSGSLVARLQQCGMIPQSASHDYPVSVYNLEPYISRPSSKVTPTPMDLVKKVKQNFSLCVKNHVVYLCVDGYYAPMEQNSMEGVIWAVCRAEVEKVGNKAILSGAYQLLTIDPDLQADNLESASNVVPFKNGLIRLDDGMYSPLTPAYFVTFTLNCEFPLNYGFPICPTFDKYLEDVSGGDGTLIMRIWQFIGYCLTQDTNAKAIFVLQGITSSGKSVLVNVLKAFFPKEVVTALDAHDMGEKYAIGECEGKMLCISSDMSADALGGKAVSNLKKLTGRDTVSSAVKYKNRKDFIFTGKIIMVTNNPLLLKQDDQAFWERIVTIPFRYQIPKENRISNLEDQLAYEMSAIAAKALDAYFELRTNGYQFAGSYEINSPDMYSRSNIPADPATMIYMYLQQHYEPWGEGIVILEEACKDFNLLSGLSISTQRFSAIFRQQAMEMYDVVKIRTREGGYQNARSAIKGIKRKFI